MGDPKGAPVNPPSTTNSIALTYDESSGSQEKHSLREFFRFTPSAGGTVRRTNHPAWRTVQLSLRRQPRASRWEFCVAPGTTTLTRMLRGAKSAATARAMETTPPVGGRIGGLAGLARRLCTDPLKMMLALSFNRGAAELTVAPSKSRLVCRNICFRAGIPRETSSVRSKRDVLLQSVRNAVERSRALLGREEEVQTSKARYADLTTRERDVMALVVISLLNKQVGTRLGISEITVKKHRGNAMRKMKAESLPQLVKMAARLRLRQAPVDNVLVTK